MEYEEDEGEGEGAGEGEARRGEERRGEDEQDEVAVDEARSPQELLEMVRGALVEIELEKRILHSPTPI